MTAADSPAIACATLAVNAVRGAAPTKYHRQLARKVAIFHLKAAIRHANREGFPPRARAPLFRMINWLRADVRKMGRAA